MSFIHSFESAKALFELPFFELLYRAHTLHCTHFNKLEIQMSTLLNIKTGSCPEDCSYCSQSAHNKTALKKEPLMEIGRVIDQAEKAKENGATRFCMGAAWRGPRDADLDKVCEMIREVKKRGLETCVTLGLLKEDQAKRLKEAGLDFYNHNIDTSKEYYGTIITTRTFEDRLKTLEYVQESGIQVCCGGILGLGETNDDRISMLVSLANMKVPPQSIPINKLVKIPGTPLEGVDDVDPFDFVRTVALARLLMPASFIRLSAGRESMSDELQALCFFAGCNSIFYGETLLTTDNTSPSRDDALLKRLNLEKLVVAHSAEEDC